MKTYKIVRMFMNGSKCTMDRGLTLDEAREHCRDPETSSRTCSLPENVKRTELHGPWFDGFDEE
jgi:hypothetical protein